MSEDEQAADAVREVDVSEVTEPQEPVDDVRLVTSDPPVESVEEPEPDRPTIVSDGHCPLVLASSESDRRRVVETVDGTKIVRREPDVVLQQPVECPSCGKYFERHSLILNDVYAKDCAVAISYRNNPRFKPFFDALDTNEKNARAEAKKLESSGLDVSALVAKRYGS